MTFKISTEDDMYLAVTAIHKHFKDNPDEPYIELVYDRDGQREVVGRINNPEFTELIYAVSYALDNLKRVNLRRTVQINTK
jgi:hypothetical protein